VPVKKTQKKTLAAKRRARLNMGMENLHPFMVVLQPCAAETYSSISDM
jgi:hypothetical protein